MKNMDRKDAITDIPFISNAKSQAPFADLRNRGSVDKPAEMLEGWTTQLEAAVGLWNTVQVELIRQLAEKSRAVARINVSSGSSYGTGFLVSENLLLTNNHVLESVDAARDAVAEFNYELSRDELQSGRLPPEPAIKRYRLDPDRLFITSPYQGGFDYTFVWIEKEAAEKFGCIEMRRASFTAKKGDPVFIIHHPQGRPKEVSVDDTEICGIDSKVVHYAADTDYGSSGSPVIDRTGKLIALHHARHGVATTKLPDGGTTNVLNEGIKIAAIAMDLENRVKAGGSDRGMAEKVLSAMVGSDTLAGFFGGLGRAVRGSNDIEKVVNAYLGTEEDLDLGFWNIEWLANRWRDGNKLQGAARVIADFNLDIWCLEEVSPRAVKELVKVLLDRYGETYSFAMSEPDASDSKQTTAVIWRPHTVTGRKIAWPDPISDWWSRDSRDDLGLEAVDGKIFPRHPALFEFAVKGKDRSSAFDFLLVPLHLKAMAEGSKRRRLASMLLARAIEEMAANGYDQDWIIGGDVNAELASGDFKPLTDKNMIAMSAVDEEAGAFTYLKSPKSLIDNIFITRNISRVTGSTGYFIVAPDSADTNFVREVSDHRPVVLRVSLAAAVSAESRIGDDDLKGILERIVSGRPENVRPMRRKAS